MAVAVPQYMRDLRLCAKLADYAYVSGKPDVSPDKSAKDVAPADLPAEWVCSLEETNPTDSVKRVVVGFGSTWLQPGEPNEGVKEKDKGKLLVHLGFWALWASAEGFAGSDRFGKLREDEESSDGPIVQGVMQSVFKKFQLAQDQQMEILVVGRSLGGAVSCFAALDIIVELDKLARNDEDFKKVKVIHATFAAPPGWDGSFRGVFRAAHKISQIDGGVTGVGLGQSLSCEKSCAARTARADVCNHPWPTDLFRFWIKRKRPWLWWADGSVEASDEDGKLEDVGIEYHSLQKHIKLLDLGDPFRENVAGATERG